eukprot:scaffold6198_cov408-Prasinococcus_capsulatus_cf.AAC.11
MLCCHVHVGISPSFICWASDAIVRVRSGWRVDIIGALLVGLGLCRRRWAGAAPTAARGQALAAVSRL